MTDSCTAAWTQFWGAFPRILLSPFWELIFFVAIGFATAPIFNRILIYAQAYFGALAVQAPMLLQGTPPASSTALLAKLIVLYLIFFVTVYLVYGLCEGLAWAYASKAVFPNIDGRTYLCRFARANLLWIPLYAALHLMSLLADFQLLNAESMGIAPPTLLPTTLVVFSILLAYAAFMDYALLPMMANGRLRTIFRVVPKLLPVLALIVLIFLAVNAILIWAFSVNQFFALAIGMLLVLPLFTYGRLLWMNALQSREA